MDLLVASNRTEQNFYFEICSRSTRRRYTRKADTLYCLGQNLIILISKLSDIICFV